MTLGFLFTPASIENFPEHVTPCLWQLYERKSCLYSDGFEQFHLAAYIVPAVDCHYFPPGPPSPPRPQSITALWPVPNYTAWRRVLERLAQSRCAATPRRGVVLWTVYAAVWRPIRVRPPKRVCPNKKRSSFINGTTVFALIKYCGSFGSVCMNTADDRRWSQITADDRRSVQITEP